MLSARIIKALCAVLHENQTWRDSGLALLEAFDEIDLQEIQVASVLDAATRKIGRDSAIADRVRAALQEHFSFRPPVIYQIAAE
jgi:hypothetical protein